MAISGPLRAFGLISVCQGIIGLAGDGERVDPSVLDNTAMSCLPSASIPLDGEHEAVPHSDEKGRGLRGLAQRVPLKQSLTQARVS